MLFRNGFHGLQSLRKKLVKIPSQHLGALNDDLAVASGSKVLVLEFLL